MSYQTPAPVLQAVLITDFVGSTALLEQLGDIRSAKLATRLDRVLRDLLQPYSGREIDKTDGFLMLFNRSLDAVRYALSTHDALEQLAREEGLPADRLQVRVGIHVGEVVLRSNSPEDISRGAKQIEMEGLAKPLTARLMGLASAGQTLLSRTAFDLARRAAVGDETLPPETHWLAHGPYLFSGMEEPQEVYEVGHPDRASLGPPPDSEKARRAVAPGEESVLGWRPAPGQAVPGRSNFVLADKIGEGGFGEVWLARHAKTREPRVFKFCFQAERLRGLKREVTLFRLLKETLGDRDDIARVLDWRFDEAPYYLELEYTEGGNLIDWAEQQGGIDKVPLETRLELVAQTADALAAAHSVGVLHKDIKPTNILIVADKSGLPHARLTDFGIGLILDRERLLAQGITATGLTEIVSSSAPESSRTGTRLYMAPELLEGKPATTFSDIFALGVLMYQNVSGYLTRALAPGWEQDIDDDLLRDDIACCVHGRIEQRLSSAGDLAERIRTLSARREARREELAQLDKARSLEHRLRAAEHRRKSALIILVIVTALCVAAMYMGTMERNRARKEAALKREEVALKKQALQLAGDAQRSAARAEEARFKEATLKQKETALKQEALRLAKAAQISATRAEVARDEMAEGKRQTFMQLVSTEMLILCGFPSRLSDLAGRDAAGYSYTNLINNQLKFLAEMDSDGTAEEKYPFVQLAKHRAELALNPRTDVIQKVQEFGSRNYDSGDPNSWDRYALVRWRSSTLALSYLYSKDYSSAARHLNYAAYCFTGIHGSDPRYESLLAEVLEADLAASGILPDDLVIESGTGGKNSELFKTISGEWFLSQTPHVSKSVAPGCTRSIGAMAAILTSEPIDLSDSASTRPCSALFELPIHDSADRYIYITWPDGANCDRVLARVHGAETSATTELTQRGGYQANSNCDKWVFLGKYNFAFGQKASIEITAPIGSKREVNISSRSGRIYADAVLVRKAPLQNNWVAAAK